MKERTLTITTMRDWKGEWLSRFLTVVADYGQTEVALSLSPALRPVASVYVHDTAQAAEAPEWTKPLFGEVLAHASVELGFFGLHLRVTVTPDEGHAVLDEQRDQIRADNEAEVVSIT